MRFSRTMYINKQDFTNWEDFKKSPIVVNDNIIIKNLFSVGLCWEDNSRMTKFKWFMCD